MSNRLTFSLASLIVLIALGFIATPAMAVTLATSPTIGDQAWVQGQKVDIKFPKATATRADGVLTVSLTVNGTAVAAGALSAATDGPLQGLTYAEGITAAVAANPSATPPVVGSKATAESTLAGNAHTVVQGLAVIVYTVTEDEGEADEIEKSVTFSAQVTKAPDLMFPAGTSISNKELIAGAAFGEILPVATGGVAPLMYSILNSTETGTDTGLFTGGGLPPGLTFNEKSRLITGIPTGEFLRTVVTYRVTDSATDRGADNNSADTQDLRFTITVAARPEGPSFAITKVPDAAYTKGRAITAMTLQAADTTYAVGSVTYKLEGLPTGTGLSFDAATRMLTGTPSDKDQAASPIAATYTATDTASNMKSLPFKITVNDAVAVTITNPNPNTYMRGASGFQTITVAAANGTGKKTLTVSGLPAGLMFDAAKGEITGTPTMAAATEITATATDTLGAMGSKKATITVAASTPLVFESVVAPQSYEVNKPITPMLLPKGSGGIGTLTYALTGLPAGITFDATTRLLRGTPTTATPAADYNYIISDSAFKHVTSPSADQVPNTVTLPISITVTAPAAPTNTAPDFGDATIANIVATVNTAIPGMFLPEATDADGDALTYSVTPALPAGITFTATNRALTGTPTAMMSETAYTYMVADGNGGTDTIGFFITVNAAQTPPVNAPPAFAPDAMVNNITATAGMEIEGRFLPEATDPEGDLVSYWITPALPTGLSFNRTTRALTGTPTAMMSQTAYTYNAADAANLLSPATLPFFITVNEAPNVAPVYADTTPVAITGTVGVAITPMSVAATDANGDTLTYSWDVDETALGLMLNTATGVISGTPLKAHTGTHPVTATDPDGLSAMRSVTVTVSAAPPTNVAPEVTITTADPGTTPQTGSFAIAYTATDANAGDTPSVNVTHTVSPASAMGYTVDSSTAGMVTITQAAGSPIAVITVTITASDSAGLSDSESISVTFAASAPTPVDTTPPTVTVMAPIAPDAAGNLVFTFVFSEPIQASSFTSEDIRGDDYIVTAAPAMDAADTTMKTWKATVKATSDDAVTVVVNAGAVTDMAGNANVVGNFATYTPPTAPAAPAGLTATPAVGSVTFTWTVVAGSMYEYNTDGTTWMDATAGSVTVSGSTAITFNVRVKAASGVPAGMTATVTATPTAPAGPAPISLAAKGYLVIVGAGFDATTLPGVTPTEVAGFPADLAAYLVAGGTINVAATGGDVIINEFMVARDTNKVGSGDPADGQWIELYNKHATEAATGITVTFNQSKPASSPAGYADRFTNVAGQGWNFQGKFGAAVLNGSTKADAAVNFISIRRTDAGKDGSDQNAWGTAVAGLLFAPGRVGTPGAKNTIDVFTPVPNDRPKLTDTVIISEVANRTDDTKEWIELKGPAGKSLKNWRLNIVTAVGTENTIFAFPNNDNVKISANGYLLLTDVDPLNGELAADYANGVPAPNRYKNGVVTLGALPNDGNFVLVLRHRADKNGTHEAIEDIAGYSDKVSRANPYATLWPLRGNAGVISSHNKLVGGKVYRRARTNIHGYSATAGNKLHESAFAAVGFTGIGYDRNANANDPENGGTPGYPHGTFKGDGADAPGHVIISEIMYATHNGVRGNRNLPQWIEIHNTSDTNGVNLANWRLDIVNSGADGYAGKFAENISLSGTIPPNQTYLIVARIGVSQNTRLPTQRIKNAGKKFNEHLINPKGFHLTLKAKTHKGANEHVIVDTAGNLNDPVQGNRRADARSFAGNAWELENAIAEDGSRISISRRTSPKLNAKGTDQAGWILTDIDPRYGGIIQLTHYGRSDDRSTPGYTIGGALPVSLSKFRPERLATGEVVVRWVTESETNNAGFNILRSDAKDGQFTKLNTKLIAGQGTTSERTAYEFTDTSAKPNVVYYYQIQDVSFDGEVATLRTTHLRGNVTPAGKITTTWGELKALQ